MKTKLNPRNSERAFGILWIWGGVAVVIAGVAIYLGLHQPKHHHHTVPLDREIVLWEQVPPPPAFCATPSPATSKAQPERWSE